MPNGLIFIVLPPDLEVPPNEEEERPDEERPDELRLIDDEERELRLDDMDFFISNSFIFASTVPMHGR